MSNGVEPVERRIEDGEIRTGCLALNEHWNDLVFQEKLANAMNAITDIAGNDENETLEILMHATAFQAAFLHADKNPDCWVPDMSETMTELVRKHYIDGHRRGNPRPTFFSFPHLTIRDLPHRVAFPHDQFCVPLVTLQARRLLGARVVLLPADVAMSFRLHVSHVRIALP